MRWIKKPPREDKLNFLALPIKCDMGPAEETGMSTDHKIMIWLEFVRVTRKSVHDDKFRIMTLKEIGYDYRGDYFDRQQKYINFFKVLLCWIAALALVGWTGMTFAEYINTRNS